MRALSFKNEKGGLILMMMMMMVRVMIIMIIWIINIFRIKILDYLNRSWIKVKLMMMMSYQGM